MFTLSFNGKTEKISQDDNIETIKRKFNIRDSKNLYRVSLDGELIKLDDANLPQEIREGIQIEALSDFTLG